MKNDLLHCEKKEPALKVIRRMNKYLEKKHVQMGKDTIISALLSANLKLKPELEIIIIFENTSF